MNRDDIIRMAHEAGLHIATDHDWMPIIALAYAQKFAELVAAAEREACAKVCGDMLAMTRYEKIPQEVRVALYEAQNAIRARGQG